MAGNRESSRIYKPYAHSRSFASEKILPMPITLDLSNSRALITGASSGIGLGIAAVLAHAGCDVAGCGLEQSEKRGRARFFCGGTSARTTRLLSTRGFDGGECRPRVCGMERLAVLGGIDFVISNAGANFNVGAAATTEETWHANMELNLASHWRLAQTAKPYLDAAPNPVVILMASVQSFRTFANSFPYNVAKAGLLGMVQSLALEWGPHARVLGIAPGFVDTPLNIEWFGRYPDPAAKRAQVENMHALKRIGTPEDVGNLCAFLCSPLAGFITGTTIVIDGGRSAVLQDI